jgi:L-alanine-DL-glutamate epimerase-like enolase superfamily enzyme
VPYARYNETPESVVAEIRRLEPILIKGAGRDPLSRVSAAGAARNAVDCALWDLEGRLAGLPVAHLAGLGDLQSELTAYTLSLGTPEAMAHSAARNAHRPLLKVKLGADGDSERIRAVRDAAPTTRLIVDANEGWHPRNLKANFEACLACGVELVEQPLPDGQDEALAGRPDGLIVCADESIHTRAELERLRSLYDAINIKLDKTGGLTEALALKAEARLQGFQIMVGCMLGTSLAMAPAILVAQHANYVDLDGPLLLASDRDPPLEYEDGRVFPPAPMLWGG